MCDGDVFLVDVDVLHWLGGFLARAARPRPSRRHAMRVGDGCEGGRRHARARAVRATYFRMALRAPTLVDS